jgi:hypothetical protein
MSAPALLLGLNRITKARIIDLPSRDGIALAIGSAKTGALVLDDPDISKHHAKVTVTAAGHQIEDLGAMAGVVINDQPIAAATLLRDGDELRLGSLLFRYLIGADAATRAADAVADLATHDPVSRLPIGAAPDAALLRPIGWRELVETRGAIAALQAQRELGRRLAAQRGGPDQITSVDGWCFAVSPAERAADVAEAATATPIEVEGGPLELALIVEEREP